MGWTACASWNSKKDVINEIVENLSAYDVIAQKSTTQAWYAVIEHKETRKRNIFVALVNKISGWYGYKDMDEGMGPSVDDCPLVFFDLVPEPPNEYAVEFRARCRAFHAQKIERQNKTRYFILALYVNGECTACMLAKPIGKSKRRFSHSELQPFLHMPGNIKNLGEIYK